ncbi:MAG: hypothetical protein MRERV_5c035 [Mycoplasmataceae bacterium RV_VA103A]|nr:MAG: hypothetical protein MRERV_5c035 [Mycoplasmataceae bacterium RV_VA103A]
MSEETIVKIVKKKLINAPPKSERLKRKTNQNPPPIIIRK